MTRSRSAAGDNLFLLDRGRLVRRLGSASPETLKEVCAALAIAVDCGA